MRLNRDGVKAGAVALVRDTSNRLRYGPHAPRFCECLWINPALVRQFDLDLARRAQHNSARVVSGSWLDQNLGSMASDPILQTSIARWGKGLPWIETGEVERMEQVIAERGPIHNCRTREDILRRCAHLDEVFASVKRERRLRTQGELDDFVFREKGGIGMHIGPDGIPVRAGNGRHRFAMALILGLSLIPARVGLVHQSALATLPAYRRGSG